MVLKILFYYFFVLRMILNFCFSVWMCFLEFCVLFVRIVIKFYFIEVIDGIYWGWSLVLSMVRVKFERYIIVYCINIY